MEEGWLRPNKTYNFMIGIELLMGGAFATLGTLSPSPRMDPIHLH